MSLTPGTKLGPYEILAPLGAGGMGEVYKAKDLKLGRDVAIKVLREDLASDPERLRRFEQEARAASSLNHPNIVTIHDIGEHEGTRFIAMEYVEGKTLREMLGGESLPTKKLLKLSTQIADGLAKAHAAGIVHRDLKPENLMVTGDGFVKILDFGLVKLMPEPSEIDSEMVTVTKKTREGTILGTVQYMSPEQAAGRPVDYRSDQFSFGSILYEMATGKLAYQRDTVPETQAAIIRDEPEPISVLNPKLPAPVRWIVERCLAKEPEERYASTRDLARELESLQEHAAELSSEPIPVTAPQHLVQPRRTATIALVGILAAGLTLVVGLNLGGWWDRLSRLTETTKGPVGTELPIVAVLPLANVSGDPTIDHVGVGIAHILLTKLSAIPSVTTISRSATLEYIGQSRDTRKIAQDLGASFVVNGSVQRLENRLHVTVNLVRADDSVVWGGDYEGNLSDLFDFQRQLASGLTEALHLNLTPTDIRRLEAPPTSNMDAYAEFSQGREFLERTHVPENLDRAIKLLESAVKKDPSFVLAHAALGEAYWTYFNRTTDSTWTDKARLAAEEARRLDPDHPAVRNTLAIIYQGTGRVDEAIEELRSALSVQPNNDDSHALLGQILAEQGRIEEAAQELRRAIDIRPNFWGHYRSLGMAYYNAGRLPDAALAFQRVTELQPDLPAGFQALGVTYHAMGEVDRAVPNYLKSIELGPAWAAHSNLGTIYYRQGKFSDAAQSYQEALKLNPSSPGLYRNLGDAYRKLDRKEDARAAYLKAAELYRNLLKVNPRDPSAMGRLAVVEAKLGRTTEALRLATEAAELAPQDGKVLYSKAVVHALAGQTEEALGVLQKALDHGYSESEARLDDDLAALKDLPEYSKLLET